MTSRLDAAIAARGLARSRTHAATLIAAGLVTVDGAPVSKASVPVRDDQQIVIAGADHYVSRAAHKLIAALDAFGVDPAGRVALDAGASTGGFTQVLLERGARSVLAVDVGHGQLVPEIRDNERVIAIEGFNIRDLTRDQLQAWTQLPEFPTLVVADLSFISLNLVVPVLFSALPEAEFVLLVKPQFEVGRTGIREGIVLNAGLRDDAVMAVLWAAWDLGLGTVGVISSPIAGTAGNHEYLVHLDSRRGTNPSEWMRRVTELTH